MDLATLNWSPQLLEWFQVPLHCLPQCTPIGGNFGVLKDTAIPVLAVNGDQNAAFFGAGQLECDSALINLGSGAFILREIGFKPRPSQITPRPDPGLESRYRQFRHFLKQYLALAE